MKAIQTTTIESQLVKIDEYLMNLIRRLKASKNNQERLSLQMKANYLSEIMNYNEEILVDASLMLGEFHPIDLDELIDLYEQTKMLIENESAIQNHISRVLSSQAYYMDTLEMKEPKMEMDFVSFFNSYAAEFLGMSTIKNFGEYQGKREFVDLERSTQAYLSQDESFVKILNDKTIQGIQRSIAIITHLNQRLLSVLGN